MNKVYFLIILYLFYGCGSKEYVQYNQTTTHQTNISHETNTTHKTDTTQQNNNKTTISIKPYFSLTNSNYKLGGGVDELIVDDINSAKNNIRLAIYGFTNDRIRDALVNAKERGIDIKIITDDSISKREDIVYMKNHEINITDDQDKSALMHDKFLVIDNYILWSGSANYTYYSFYKNNENLVRIKSKKISSVYLHEFNEIYTHNYIKNPYISDTIEIYFSPEDNYKKRVLSLIKGAKKSIKFLMYAFTDKDIAKALQDKFDQGVDIKGVVDKRWNSNKYSQFNALKEHGLDVRLDGNSLTMHDKVLIIDDNTVETGSYNFTLKANYQNNENIIVVHNREFASKYIDEFYKIFNLAL